MGKFVILDATVHNAFKMLEAHVFPAAAAKADRLRREDLMKAAKAQGFVGATGNVAEREAQSILSDAYVAACEGYYAAVELEETYRLQRDKNEKIIEAWRSTNANRRMGRTK